MNGLPDWNDLADLAGHVRTTFEAECLVVYNAMTRSPILGALRLAPSLTRPRTVALDQDVLEAVFGSFGPDHAFNAFTPGKTGMWNATTTVTTARLKRTDGLMVCSYGSCNQRRA